MICGPSMALHWQAVTFVLGWAGLGWQAMHPSGNISSNLLGKLSLLITEPLAAGQALVGSRDLPISKSLGPNLFNFVACLQRKCE